MKYDKIKETAGKLFFKLPVKGRMRWAVAGLVILVILVAVVFFVFHKISASGASASTTSGTYEVKRGPLSITETQSGEVKAVNAVDLRSDVEGRTTIIYIVDEGIEIKPEDVNNKVLVELDSSDIKLKLTQQEITYLAADASYTDANESLAIQKKQNESDITGDQLKVRFALMDMQKYLGAEVAGKLLADTNDAADDANDVSETDSNKIASLINEPNLGGDASQKLKELNDAILLANANFAQANGRLVWTKKLNDANYASKSDVEEDELKVQSYKIQKEKAVMELDLFRMYGFPKQAETLVSDYAESQRKLERTQASARSKLGQAIAKLQSNKATYLLQKDRWEKLKKQFEACKIKAPAPGQVVYASSIGSSWERQNNPIKLGAEVRERQKIISIPDTNAMKVEVKIHETWIDKIKEGQRANITLTAFPDKTFTGEVLKRSPLADQDNWFNPDLKVYATDVSIEGSFGFLKTGMTAKVEIIIDELEDVISVPIQAVVNREGKKLCYIERGLDPLPREVETGAFNDSFVEIKSGLSEGDTVLLNPPRIKEAVTPGPKPGKKINKKLG